MIQITKDLAIPARKGERPLASEAPEGTMLAHQQQSQNAPYALQEEIYRRAINLPHVSTGPSLISVPGARAFNLQPTLVRKPPNVGTEFAHLHPPYDGSLHINLTPDLIKRIEEAGWGEVHPRDARVVMIWGPRDDEELEIVWSLVELSYHYALGEINEN